MLDITSEFCSILQARFEKKSTFGGGEGFLAPLGTKITLDYRPKKCVCGRGGEMLDITGAFYSMLNHILR